MGVDGIVGYVAHADLMYSRILLISDPTHHIPAKNSRNGLLGIVSGKATTSHQLQLKFVTKGLDVVVGDIFVSSALGDKFPVGLPIAKVIDVQHNNQSDFLSIQLKPLEELSQLSTVLLLSKPQNDGQ